MTEAQKNFLITLINEPGPSGYEENVQKIWRTQVSAFCKDIHKDIHGNVTAVLNPGKDFSVMIVGHADEIGLIVSYIDDNGYIYFNAIGGVDPSILGSQRARIITRKGIIDGVFGQKSLHLEESRVRKIPKQHEVFIDIGVKNKNEAEKFIMIGDPIVFGNDYMDLKNNLAASRCFDNRIGIYIVAEVLKKLSSKKLNTTVYGVSSVQEEIGVKGAGHPAYEFDPSMAIALDVMPATDYPGVLKEAAGDVRIGRGPVIRRGVRTSSRVSDKMIDIARKKKYDFQVDMDNGRFGTDSDAITSIKKGIPAGGMEIATRYLHSSEEVLSLTDLDKGVDLLADIITEIDKDKGFLTRE